MRIDAHPTKLHPEKALPLRARRGREGRSLSLSLFFRGETETLIRRHRSGAAFPPEKERRRGKARTGGTERLSTHRSTERQGRRSRLSRPFSFGVSGGYNIKPFGGWTCPFVVGDPCEAVATAYAQQAAVSRSQYRETQFL